MLFHDLLESEGDRRSYQKACTEFGEFFQECAQCLIWAWDVVHETAGKTAQEHHTSILALARHVIESIDGISILVAKGSGNSAQPLLRSALEAFLGVLYILETDTERRALAYTVAHAHKRIKLYNRLDPTTQQGREFRRTLDGDPFEEFFNRLPLIIYPDRLKNLQNMLGRAPYMPIEEEWQSLKAAHPRKEDPAWYSLFSGPRNVRDLAICLKWAGLYEILYRVWSDEVHAGNALKMLGKIGKETVWRPVRHPEMLQSTVQHGTAFSLMLAQRLIQVYAPDRWSELQTRFQARISARMTELGNKRVIHAPWKNTLF